MNTLQPTNQRIDVADVLRGVAIMGIIILHSIEHFNFYKFPPELPYEWFAFTDKAIWDGLFFLFGGKAYAIFALLFGFSFYIQDSNQQKRGKDFRLRFAWRLTLLFLLGQVNAAFFTGEILVFYAVMGFILILTCRLSDKVVLILAIICMLQPLELYKIVYGLVDPDALPQKGLAGYYFNEAFKVQDTGTFWETVKMNLWEGQLANFTWAWEHGRVFQTASLFLLGMLTGRKGLFLKSEYNLRFWVKCIGFALLFYFPLTGLAGILPQFISSPLVLQGSLRLLESLHKVCFMLVIAGSVILLFYYTNLQKPLMKLAPYGKMSLTNYFTQSIIGSALFYHWGLYLQLGITYSFLVGILLFLAQFLFCTWWMKHHKHGPFEYVWKKLTWIGSGR